MPVQTDEVDWSVKGLRELTAIATYGNPRQKKDADQDMNSVQSGHHEVETEERGISVAAGNQVALMAIPVPGQEPFFELMRILEVLDGQENAGAQDSQDQKENQFLLIAFLR